MKLETPNAGDRVTVITYRLQHAGIAFEAKGTVQDVFKDSIFVKWDGAVTSWIGINCVELTPRDGLDRILDKL